MTTARATNLIPGVPDLEESKARCYTEFGIPLERVRQATAMKAGWRRRLGPDGRANIEGHVARSAEGPLATEHRLNDYLERTASKYNEWRLPPKIYVVRDRPHQGVTHLCLPHWHNNDRHNHFPLGTAISLLTDREPRLAAHIPGLRRVLKPRPPRQKIVTSLSVNPFDLLTCGVGFENDSCYAPGKQYDAGGYQLWFDAFSFVIMSYDAESGTRLSRAIGVCDNEFRRFAIRRFYGSGGSAYVKQAVRVLESALGDTLVASANPSSTTITTPAPGYADPVALRLDRLDLHQFSRSLRIERPPPLHLSLRRAKCPICPGLLFQRLWEHPNHGGGMHPNHGGGIPFVPVDDDNDLEPPDDQE